MRQGGDLLLKRFLRNHIWDNKGKYVLGVLFFILGLGAGISVWANLPPDTDASLREHLSQYTLGWGDISFVSVLKSILGANLKYIAIYFLMSLTLPSSYGTYLIPGARGFLCGFGASFLIGAEGGRGIGYTLLSILPSAILNLPLYIFTCVVCINFAVDRKSKGEVGARYAIRILPPLGVVYGVMALVGVFDVFITPVVFKLLFRG